MSFVFDGELVVFVSGLILPSVSCMQSLFKLLSWLFFVVGCAFLGTQKREEEGGGGGVPVRH